MSKRSINSEKGKRYVSVGLFLTLKDPNRLAMSDHGVLYDVIYFVALILAMITSWGV